MELYDCFMALQGTYGRALFPSSITLPHPGLRMGLNQSCILYSSVNQELLPGGPHTAACREAGAAGLQSVHAGMEMDRLQALLSPCPKAFQLLTLPPAGITALQCKECSVEIHSPRAPVRKEQPGSPAPCRAQHADTQRCFLHETHKLPPAAELVETSPAIAQPSSSAG